MTRADLMLRQSYYEIAVQSGKEALQLHRQLDSPLGTADAMRLCGTALHHLDKNKEALQILKNARQLNEEYQHPFGIAETNEMIMVLEYQSGSVEAAEKAYNNAKKAYLQINNTSAVKQIEVAFKNLQKTNQSK